MPTQPTQMVVSLPLAPSVRHALLCAGLSTVIDIRGLTKDQLMQVTGLPEELAAEVMLLVLGQPAPGWRLAGGVTAAQLLADAQGAARNDSSSGKGSGGDDRTVHLCGVSTSCAGLDALLGGVGVVCGTVTEFYGVPGVGKTQIGMQLAVNAQLPRHLGGLDSHVLYVDTEGSFMTDRLIDFATSAVQRAHDDAAAGAPPSRCSEPTGQEVEPLTVEALLSGILCMRVQHYTQQLALVGVLDMLLKQQPQVRLVVLDSATFLFRQDFTDAAQRSRLLLSMAQHLAHVAEQRGVAVVMINQVVTRLAETSTRVQSGTSAGSSSDATAAGLLAPALGEGWGQAASCRVALFWEGNQRHAMLTKAKHVPLPVSMARQHSIAGSMSVPYYVGPCGIN